MPQTSHHSSQPRRRPTERISQHVLYGLLGYVVALFLAFFLFGYDTPYWKNDRMNAPMLTDVLLGAVYGIMALTTILAIVAGIHSARLHQGTTSVVHGVPMRKISIAITSLTLVTLVVGFLASSSAPMIINGETYTDWWGLKLSGMLITTASVLLVAAIGAALFGATRYYRKPHHKG